MQILHVSDTHLGCMQFNLKEREEDVYDAFNEVIDAAIKDRVDAIIHAGDIFDKPKPSGTAMLKLGEALKRLSEHNIRFFFTLGEHDISRVRDTPSPYVYHRLGMAEYIGDGKPHRYRDLLLIGFHKHKRSESDQLRSMLRSVNVEGYSCRKVLVLHQGLAEFHQYANELSIDDLPPGFDYYAMGHLHDHAMKRRRDGGMICYPGSIDPTPVEGIREFRKGYCMVDLSGDEARVEFIPIRSSRRHMQYAIDYERLEEVITMVGESARGLAKKPVVAVKIRVRDRGDVESARIAGILSGLRDICLHYTWEVESMDRATATGVFYDERPDINSEMIRLTELALGSKEQAHLAIDEILNVLSENDVNAAIDIVWKRFEHTLSRQDSNNDDNGSN